MPSRRQRRSGPIVRALNAEAADSWQRLPALLPARVVAGLNSPSTSDRAPRIRILCVRILRLRHCGLDIAQQHGSGESKQNDRHGHGCAPLHASNGPRRTWSMRLQSARWSDRSNLKLSRVAAVSSAANPLRPSGRSDGRPLSPSASGVRSAKGERWKVAKDEGTRGYYAGRKYYPGERSAQQILADLIYMHLPCEDLTFAAVISASGLKPRPAPDSGGWAHLKSVGDGCNSERSHGCRSTPRALPPIVIRDGDTERRKHSSIFPRNPVYNQGESRFSTPYFCRFALFTVVIVVLLIRLASAAYGDRLGIIESQ